MGAPNFRRVDMDIYGVAQPTITGLSTILKLLASNGHEKSVWISTREEPLIYINGIPFVLRDENLPFTNIASYCGISSDRLEQMEERLRDDILREAAANDGLIVIHDEKGLFYTPRLCISSCSFIYSAWRFDTVSSGRR